MTSPRPPRRLRLRGRGYDSPADARDKSPGPGLRHPDPGMMSHTYAGCLSLQAQARLAGGDSFVVKQGDVPRTGRKGYSSSQYKRGPSPFTSITIPAQEWRPANPQRPAPQRYGRSGGISYSTRRKLYTEAMFYTPQATHSRHAPASYTLQLYVASRHHHSRRMRRSSPSTDYVGTVGVRRPPHVYLQ